MHTPSQLPSVESLAILKKDQWCQQLWWVQLIFIASNPIRFRRKRIKIFRRIFCKTSNCSIFLGPCLWRFDWVWCSSNISKPVQLPFIDVSSRNFSWHNGQKMDFGRSIHASRVSCRNFNTNVYKICPSLGGNQQLRSGVFRRCERKR